MKVLIIGLGSIAAKHIHALNEIGRSRGFIPDIYALRSHASSDNVDGVFNLYEWSEAVELKPDFVIISNPTALHTDTILRCVQLHVPMFIEKPVFSNVTPENAKVIETVTAAGIPTYVACNLRFLPCIQYIHDRLKKTTMGRRINEVNIYCGSYLPSWRPGTDYRKSYSASPRMGGGVHLDLIHELDYATWLFGYPRGYRSTLRSHSTLGIDSIDYANYLFEYQKFCASITLNYYRSDYKRTLEIVFDDDTWLVDLVKDRVTDSRGKLLFDSTIKIQDTYLRQMEYFVDKISGTSFPHFDNDIVHAYDILKIALRQ